MKPIKYIVENSRDSGTPEEQLRIDRQKAADLQVSVKQIAEALRTILAGTSAGEYREEGDEYTILVKVKDSDLLSIDELLDMTIRNQNGDQVILRNLVSCFHCVKHIFCCYIFFIQYSGTHLLTQFLFCQTDDPGG